MSKVDPEFLRDVQRAGWSIDYADQEWVRVACPRQGCSTKLTLRPGKKVPETCARGPEVLEVPLGGYDQARQELRRRREQLGLSIEDVESAAGLTKDHLAKVERDESDRKPNLDTFVAWANALGYSVFLRQGNMPPVTLRLLAYSRDKLQDRRKRIAYNRRIRSGG